MQTVDRSNSEHYSWGDGCDGWHLLKRDDLSIITERFPPGANEQLHRHLHLLQFFYILTGEAIIKIDGVKHLLQAQQGIEIPPGVDHQFCNESISDVMFLTISMPKVDGDRVEKKTRTPGYWKDRVKIADDLDAPLPAEILAGFLGMDDEATA